LRWDSLIVSLKHLSKVMKAQKILVRNANTTQMELNSQLVACGNSRPLLKTILQVKNSTSKLLTSPALLDPLHPNALLCKKLFLLTMMVLTLNVKTGDCLHIFSLICDLELGISHFLLS